MAQQPTEKPAKTMQWARPVLLTETKPYDKNIEKQAAQALMNISWTERKRRVFLGALFSVVSIVVGISLVNSPLSRWWRLLELLPLGLAFAFFGSGTCGV
jgi:hypothetical protein